MHILIVFSFIHISVPVFVEIQFLQNTKNHGVNKTGRTIRSGTQTLGWQIYSKTCLKIKINLNHRELMRIMFFMLYGI